MWVGRLRSLILATMLVAGCSTMRREVVVSAQHPASPDAVEAPPPPESTTLAVGPRASATNGGGATPTPKHHHHSAGGE